MVMARFCVLVALRACPFTFQFSRTGLWHVVHLPRPSVPSCGLVAAPFGALLPFCCGSSASSLLFRSCLLLGQGCGWPAGAFVVALEGPVNSLVGHGLCFFYHVDYLGSSLRRTVCHLAFSSVSALHIICDRCWRDRD